MRNANSTGNPADAAGAGITLDEIDEFLGLFRELQELQSFELPGKGDKLWAECEKKAHQKLSEDVEKRAAQFMERPAGRVTKRMTSGERERNEQTVQKRISEQAEMLYREKDKKYAKAVGSRDVKINACMKKIDHLRYALADRLPPVLRSGCEGSTVSSRELRDSVSVRDILVGFPTDRMIDALEAERAKVERQPAKARRDFGPGIVGWIKGWLWKLYEKTLKVVVEAILERIWPKSN